MTRFWCLCPLILLILACNDDSVSPVDDNWKLLSESNEIVTGNYYAVTGTDTIRVQFYEDSLLINNETWKVEFTERYNEGYLNDRIIIKKDNKYTAVYSKPSGNNTLKMSFSKTVDDINTLAEGEWLTFKEYRLIKDYLMNDLLDRKYDLFYRFHNYNTSEFSREETKKHSEVTINVLFHDNNKTGQDYYILSRSEKVLEGFYSYEIIGIEDIENKNKYIDYTGETSYEEFHIYFDGSSFWYVDETFELSKGYAGKYELMADEIKENSRINPKLLGIDKTLILNSFNKTQIQYEYGFTTPINADQAYLSLEKNSGILNLLYYIYSNPYSGIIEYNGTDYSFQLRK